MNRDLSKIDIDNEDLLISKCLEDDRIYQEAFYRKFAPKMLSVCKNYTQDRDEAMDFLQDGFIAVFKSLHKYRFEGSLEGWVRKIIVFKTIDLLRKKKRYDEVLQDVWEEGFQEEDDEEIGHINSTAEQIRCLVNELPKKAGLVLKLYAIEGYSHSEIAEILGVSIGTSKSQLNRARGMIKLALKK